MTSETEHYLTYQHNVQRYFQHHADKYSGVIVPMTIAVSFPGGTYGFVRALCAKDKTKRYAIDPRTPLFQKEWDRSQVRDPHKRMAKQLGEPFQSEGLERPLRPADFVGRALKDAVQQCIAYQRRFRTREEDARKLAKYKKLLGVSNLGELREPLFVIPPYFQVISERDPWFDVSCRAVELAGEFAEDVPLRAVVHMRKWDAVGDWNKLLKRYKAAGCTEVFLYPNDFPEHEAALEELQLYRSAVEACAADGVNPYALFGGYFAILMGNFGLNGFANGVGYGEWRDSGYHRGGTAVVRIYMPKLHRYLDPPAAQRILDHDADYFAGGSDLLSECADDERPLSELTQEESLDHFMECRSDEVAFVAGRGIAAAREELEETVRRLERIGPLEREKYGESLARWLRAIE